MTEHTMRSRLAACEAFGSLVAEQRLASLLRKLHWRASHGFYYRDALTRKWREIDVCATRMLVVREDAGLRMVLIRMLVEAKSARGYHVLFSPDQPPDEEDRLDRMWLGENQRARKWTMQRLRAARPGQHSDGELTRLWDQMAYNDEGESIMADLIVPPPPATYRASAFRETNVGATKELESSVLWRARLGLGSAVAGMKRRDTVCWFDSINVARDFAEYDRRDVFSEMIDNIGIQMRFVNVYHPVVVMDAQLWWVGDGKPKPIDWCRLRQHSVGTSWWCDVVQAEQFTRFANTVTKHYKAALKACSRGRETL